MKLKNYLLTIISCAINSTPFFIKRVKNYGLLHVQLLLFAVFLNTTSHAQTFKTFTKRYSAEYKGDMLTIGNNILGKNNTALNDNTLLNENVSMQYIDIDSDTSTFNSSSADLSVPSTVSCFRIAYAGLYWGAIINTGDSRTDIEKIKLKLPGNTSYTDINGEIIYDAVAAPIVPDSNKPYACYADVTSLLSALTNPQGTYTAANIKSSTGSNGGTGLAAGWTLFVVYEDPASGAKSMSSFDGFSALYDGKTLDIPISGFRTPSTGTINLKFAFASLNGDKTANGSKVEISNGTANGTSIVTTQRPSNNFFNSSITNTSGYFTSRNPNGTNSLGYDTGIEQLLNVNKSTVDHDATTATVTLQVAKGQANPVFSFFNAFAVDVIAPEIKLTKIVKDINGNDIGNTNVSLGDNLYYEIGFQNIGNDNVDKFTLKDVLPTNVIFNYPADITSLPTGVTHTYNSATRTLQFSIPNALVEVGDVAQTIRLHVQLISDYSQLSVGCSNEIKNQAFATYQGVINTKIIQDEGSFSTTTCNFGTPSSTNFLVNIDGHTFTKTSVLCGASTTLSAADGYTSYSWSTSPTGTPIVSTNQTYTATSTGTYYVTSTSSCRTIKEEITVIPFGNTITNPVIPYADEVVTCQNNGKALPNIFLCGANASRLIQTNISDASSIEWEKLNESSCAAQTIANCANENTACQWNVVATGANFTVNTAGQYRVTLKYSGGCFSRFYFNVYQNLLNPTYTTKDIVCTTNGKITIGGVPAGYEYSLDGTNYLSSNIFTITTAGSYTVYIRQVGVTTNPCIFSVPNILIRKRNFSGTTITTQPSCNGDKGSIKIAAVDADPQYYYSISQGATLVNSVGPITASDYEFAGLNAGTYTVRVWTDDGCDYSTTITITNPPLLTATSALTKPLTCTDGEITVYPLGGTPPYAYYVNGSLSSQSVPQIVVSNPLPTGGVYSIEVVDSKNCKATTSITVAAIAPPVYTVSQTDILCYNNTTGEIKFNVSNANGYTLAYSIDNGATYSTNPTFSNLSAGTYNAIVKYSLAGTDCFSTAQTITLTQSSTALTASAGVSELAGCGPSGEGKIRITNPQGGTPFPSPNFYLYSFDNQASWITTNEAYLMPGTYTVYIKDANGCIYPMSVTIDAVPPAPTIAVDSSSFNCDGTATSTVTVTNDGGSNYSYEYLIDGTVNPNTTDPKVFLNVPSGSHTISVKYQLLSVSTYSNLLNEDFGSGSEVSSPGINAAFCFEKQNFLTCDKNGTLNNGEYTVTNTIKNGIYSGWNNPVDHTAGSSTGRYLAVDAGTAIPNNAVLYRKTIQDIIPNQPIQVRFFATNLLKIGNTQPDASLTVELQNSAGTALSSQSTGAIPKTNGWVEYNRTINPGNNTTLDFVLRLELAQVNGIDFAVDDIQVYQLPKSCTIQKDFAVVIPTNQAFDASVTGFKNISCAGANDGTITIAAQNYNTTNGFQYSINGGTSWTTQMTSPYTITGLAAGTYNLQIRYDAASTGSCVKSFTQILTQPTALVTNAAVSSLATCSTGATITASVTGGTAAYRYELWDAAGTTNIRPSQNSGIFSNVTAASYIVRGYDANNCSDDSPAVTVVNPATLTATLDPSSDLCYDTANQASLTVNVSGGVSPFVYSLDGTASQNSNTFANVGVGTHSILVTDSFGCTAPALSVTIAPQLTINAILTKDLDCTSSPDAVITATVAGGYTPFSYQLKINGGSYGAATAITGNSFSYSTATAGTYQFQITDTRGCTTESGIITINPVVNPSATTTITNVSCNGLSDGSVIIIPSLGVAPYSYSFNGSPFSSTTSYSGLAAGTYSYIVKDSKDCVFNGSATITQPTALTTTATATTFSCSPSNTKQSATVTIALPTTGTAPYQYSFNGSGYSATNTLTVNDNGTDQTINYSVKDANGCTFANSITILKLNPPTAGTITNSAVTCNAATSTVTVTPTAGTGVGTLNYEITFPVSAATSNTTGIFNGLAPDTYIFKVTDTNGCYYTQSITVSAVTPIAIAGNKTSDVLCYGDNSGSGIFTVSGNAVIGAYSFTLTTGTLGTGTLIQSGNTISLSNVATGTYTVEVTDTATGCKDDATIVITQPTAALSLSLASNTNANCNLSTSQVTVTASGGTANYSYSFVQDNTPAGTYSASNTASLDPTTNLNWDVYVKDANGCIAKLDVVIAKDPSPTVTASIPNQCSSNGNSYTITAIGSGGIGTLSYSIGAGFQSSPSFSVTATGTYTVTVKDTNGCTGTTTVSVYPVITATAVLTKDLSCTSPTDATITINATGGNGAYSYRVSSDGGTTYSTSGLVANVFTTATTGTYQFEITDTNGCTKVSNSVTINPIVPPVINTLTQSQQIFCNGDATAAITVAIDNTKGIAPFTYSIDGTNFQSSNTFTGLAAGTYTVTLKDSKGCTDTESITINQPTPITVNYHIVDITCDSSSGISKGSIIIDAVSGGNRDYNYFVTGTNGYSGQELNNGGTASITFDIVDFGLYQINVVDANGCSKLIQNILVASPPNDLDIQVNTTANCSMGGTAEIELGGTLTGAGPFYFSVYTGPGLTYPGPTWIPEDTPKHATFTGLIPGVTYTFVVYDSNSKCYYFEISDVAVPTNSTLTTSNLVPKNISCKGNADGKISFDISSIYNVPTDVTYEIYNSLSLVSTGITGSGTIPANGTLSVTDLGNLAFGNYIVVIKEAPSATNPGCSIVTNRFNITESAIDLSITASVIQNANCNNNGIINAQAKDGTAPYLFMISASATLPSATDPLWGTSSSFNAAAGNHYVYVKDAYGCIKSTTVQTVPLDPSPEIALAVTDNCAAEGTFEIVVSQVTAGIAPYSISINGSAFQNISGLAYTLSNLNSGSYSITLRDLNGCTDTETITLHRKLAVTPVITKELDCTSSPDAIITLNAADGLSPFTYQVSTDGGTTYGLSTSFTLSNSTTYNPATAGTYTFKVIDANGCENISTAIIDAKVAPDFTFIQTNETCINSDNGTITITPTTGVGPFTYSVDNGANFQSSNVFTALNAATTYTIIVKDSKSCNSGSKPATITQPTVVSGTGVLTQGLTCDAGNTTQAAVVNINGSGGTAPYTYSFNGGISYSSTNSFSTYTPGTVSAYVKDSNGCISVTTVDVPVPPLAPPTDLTFSATPIYCAPVANQTSMVSLTPTNGVGTLSYAIISPAIATSNVSGASSGIFTGLLPDTYLFQVTDANGCTYREAYTVNPVNNISVAGLVTSDAKCFGDANGSAEFTVTNYTGTYTAALISGSAATITQTANKVTITGLVTGNYILQVTDNTTACTAQTSVTVNQPTNALSATYTTINANCNFGAQVKVTASGGTPNYRYAFVQDGATTPVASDYSNNNNAVLNPATNTQWDAYVLDANNCVTKIDVTIATDPLPSVSVNPYSECPSATGTYTFTVVGSGMAPFEYSIGTGFQTNPSFTVNAPGSYNVTVKDKNACITTATALVNISPALQLQANITALPSCADGDGTLTLSAGGGSGSYEYQLDSGSFQASANFTNIFAGLHTVTVRDITTGCIKSIQVNLAPATPITGFALTPTAVSCNGGNDGSITATMTTPAPGVNDNPVYMYSLSGAAIRPAQASNIFTGLTAGNYTVTVVSGRGCTTTANTAVNEPAIISVPSPTVAQFGCTSGNAMNFASITVTGVTGGSGIYLNYEFIKNGTRVYFGPNNIYQEANLSGGSYVVNVFDNKGCIGTTTTPITIAPYIALDKINVTVNNAITCTNLEDITVTVSSIGGTPTNLQYTLVDKNATTGITGGLYPSQTNTTGVFTGLPVANYLITVKNLNTNCEIQSIHYVYEPNTFDLTIDNIVDVTCFGGTNGSANVTIIDRNTTNGNQAGAFSYTITGPVGSTGTSATAGPFTLTNLAAGTYTITATLTNSPFCQVSKAFTINQPTAALKISETHTPITCIPGNDGSISVSATGGWPGGYQFELSGPVNVAYSAQSNFTNLSAGLYTVRVKDSKGCVDQVQVTLVNPTPIAATATPNTTVLSCFGDKNATITVTNVTGGQGSNYSYILNTISPSPTSSGPQLSPTFSGLGAGTYTVTVKDGYNCSFTSANIIITEPTVVTANLVVTSTQTCQTQTRLTLTASGGTAPYSYSDTANFATTTAMTANSTTFSVPVGTYRYYIKDANGCTSVVSNNIKIDPLPSLVINLDKTNAFINCKGDNSGDIVATAQGGLGNYVYSLLDGAGNPVTPTPTQLSPGSFTGLFAGNYMVRVTSGDCTTTSALINITEPLAPLAAPYTTKNVSCNGAKNGEIVINATGGTGTIQYAISPNLNQFYNTNTFTNLVPGNYDVIVQDKLGCYIKINFTITEPQLLSASTIPLSIIPEICAGDKDGAFSITIAGGTAPYSVSLDNINGTYTTGALTQTDFDFTGLTGGNHVVYIRDAAGCTTDWSVPLPESINMSPVAVVTYDCVNNAASNLITVTVDSSITNPADVDYSLDGGTYQTGNTFTNIPAGTHFVRTRHSNGCEQQTSNFNVAQIDPLTLVLSDGGLNEIVATASGGGGNYQYTLNGESYGDTHNFIIYKSGNYTVTVTDTNGCVASATRYFEYIDVCIPNHFTPNGDGVQDGWAPGCTINYKDLTFDIFDRYGRKVASYRLGQYWDGKYNGSELPTGDYWYVIRLNDPKDNREFVGHFTLYR